MKRWLTFLLIALNLFFAVAGFAEKITDAPSGATIYVQDSAGIISSADERSIVALGGELESKTGAQLAVLTVSSLEGQPIEDYALNFLRTHGIGQKEKNNGVLILVAPNEKRSRIEVGYGLEGVLTDGTTGMIQDRYMLPHFRRGDYSTGIKNGYSAMTSIIAKNYGVSLSGTVPDSAPAQNDALQTSNTLVMLLVLVLLVLDQIFLGGFFTRILLTVLLLFGRGSRGGGRGGFGGGSGGGGGSSRSW